MSENVCLDNEDNDEIDNNASAYSEFYKFSNRTISFTQEKKRQFFLQKQKEKRQEAFDEKRNLSQLFTDDSLEPMECEYQSKRKLFKKFPFGYKLMGSEWFTEIPEDLTDNWLVKLCPEGVRNLVVANKAITTCYYRNGRSNVRFRSKLPGGNPDCGNKFTVLDCIYNKNVNTLFVYDVLAWNSMSLLNAEAHMRFYWLKSKFDENPEMCSINPDKKFNFLPIDSFPADKTLLQDQLFTPFKVAENELPFDGVLFYHREGHYNFGRSPLVGWLRTFMVPEILHIDVHPSHFQNKPDNYESVEQYLLTSKKKKKKDDSVTMEMEETEVENIDCDDL